MPISSLHHVYVLGIGISSHWVGEIEQSPLDFFLTNSDLNIFAIFRTTWYETLESSSEDFSCRNESQEPKSSTEKIPRSILAVFFEGYNDTYIRICVCKDCK